MTKEAVALDLRCKECEGQGQITVIDGQCHHAGQNCPCATHDVECGDCNGTGVVLCASCGESHASEVSEDLGLICRQCAKEERQDQRTEVLRKMRKIEYAQRRFSRALAR